MQIHNRLEKQIQKKNHEIQELKSESLEIEMKIREAEAYISGIEDTLKLIPKGEDAQNASATVRPGSDIEKARDALRKDGTAMYIEAILEAVGKEVTKKNRQALAGQLSHNYRLGRIFTRPKPNTFGLIEWDLNTKTLPEKEESTKSEEDVEFPPNFGSIPSPPNH